MAAAHRHRLSTLLDHLAPRSCSAVADRIQVEPLAGLSFGCQVLNCNVDQDLDDPEAFQKLRKAFLDYGLLVFPVQKNPDGSLLTREQQTKFVSRFGQVDHSLVVSNIRRDGVSLVQDKAGDRNGLVLHSTEGWHADATYLPLSMKAGFIYAELMPDTGGETEIADMCSGFEALDDKTKARIVDLRAYHSLEAANVRRSGTFPTHGNFGSSQAGSVFDGKAYLRPLVKPHPETGRQMLLAPMHAFNIEGMEEEESVKLLDQLIDVACQHPRVHTQKWTAGEMMFWDQRRCFHRARPYQGARRIHSIRLKGDPSSTDQAIVDQTEGTEAFKSYVGWLGQTKPWEKPDHSSARGGFDAPYKE